MFIALVLQHAVCMRHIILPSVACPALQDFSTVSHTWHDFQKKGNEHKMYVFISSTTFVWKICHSNKNWVRYDQKYILVFMWSTCYSCQILIKLEFSWQIFRKSSDIKFHKNPFSGSHAVPCGQMDSQTDRRTDTMKLIAAFHSFVNQPSNRENKYYLLLLKRSKSVPVFSLWQFPCYSLLPAK
jgi:hypothetical protein